MKYPKIRANKVGGVKAKVDVIQLTTVMMAHSFHEKSEMRASFAIIPIESTELKISGMIVKKIDEIRAKEYLSANFKRKVI